MIPDIKETLYTTDMSENARYAFVFTTGLANRYGAGIGGPVEESLADKPIGSTSRRALGRCEKHVLLIRIPEKDGN